MNTLALLPNKIRPRARVEELAVLPVFLKLRGKKAILAGGTPAATWKAELLAACGAQVHIYAKCLDPVFAALVSGTSDSSYVWHQETWSRDSFSHAAIAICDAEDNAQAREFFETAQICGVPVNVIDKPQYCEFQFGSIVNRSPAIVAISTDGAAPILGQAIRRKIETLLPQSLTNWAKLAAKLRNFVAAELPSAGDRRKFWENFTDRAFGPTPDKNTEKSLRTQIANLRMDTVPKPGKVTIVGAGPGDAELLTLKAVRALQSADIILFDEAISDEVLELARREAKRLLVDENAQTLVGLAKLGKHVVRLMVGDGISGAEKTRIESLLIQADIAHVTVPGIPVQSSDLFKSVGTVEPWRDSI